MYRIISFENGFPEWYSGWDYLIDRPIFNSDKNQAIVFMTANGARAEKNYISSNIFKECIIEKIDKNDVL